AGPPPAAGDAATTGGGGGFAADFEAIPGAQGEANTPRRCPAKQDKPRRRDEGRQAQRCGDKKAFRDANAADAAGPRACRQRSVAAAADGFPAVPR
ncbi:MAG: hypothetical protein AAF589_00215, partial [Planctomycetota bacterium]